MQPDWAYVKKTTLWPYEALLQKLNAVLQYPLLRQAYNHSMPRAIDFAAHIVYQTNPGAGQYLAERIADFERLDAAGIGNWSDLLETVATREKCSAFLQREILSFEQLIQTLNYLLRWGFPFYMSARELLDPENPQEMAAYQFLKGSRIASSFDLLERGRTLEMRQALAGGTGRPAAFLTVLVHRADIARLPFVRRKTILPLCGAGYDTLAKIAASGPAQMETDMERYFRDRGKKWADYKSVIILRALVPAAQALTQGLMEIIR